LVVQELIPVGFGVLLGSGLGFVRFSLRLPLGGALAVVLGMIATAVTGEATISWAFVLTDIPMVAVAALVVRLVAKRLSLMPREAPARQS
jgi:hypothetical protein